MVGPFQADPGDRIELTFDVENIGTAPGTQDLVLTAEDGSKITVDTLQDLELQVDQLNSATLTWDIANDQAEDTYQLCVESEDDSDCVNVYISVLPAGIKSYTVQHSPDIIFEYEASTAFDISTLTQTQNSFDTSAETSTLDSLDFADGGIRLYAGSQNDNTIYQYDLSDPYSINTASYTGNSLDISSEVTGVSDLVVENGGSSVFTISTGPDSIFEYDLSTPYDISTGTYSGNKLDVSTESGVPTGFFFNDNGSKLFMLDNSDEFIYEYSLTTNFDITTASNNANFDLTGTAPRPLSIERNRSGDRFYVIDQDIIIREISLNTAFDVTTASFTGVTKDVSAEVRGEVFQWNSLVEL